MTDEPIFIFAMDQRGSLLEHTYGIESGEPSDESDAQRVRAGKQLVYRGLLGAVGGGVARERIGVLVDEQYGTDVALLAKEAGLTLAMPVEASGKKWFELEYGDDWEAHVERFDPDLVKVLVRDNPAFDEHERTAQAERLAAVSDRLHELGRTFLFELLVPATDEQDGDDFDRDVRPGLTVEVIRFLQDHGVEPDVWKVEGLDRSEDARRIVETVQRDGRDAVRCVVLGRDAPEEQLDAWLRTAAPVDGFIGFAIGRSNWEQPLDDVVQRGLEEVVAQDTIAANYRHFVDTWTEAAG